MTTAGSVAFVRPLRSVPEEHELTSRHTQVVSKNAGTSRYGSSATRRNCAVRQGVRPRPPSISNPDESSLRSRVGNFTKGMLHSQSGEVEPGSYDKLLDALTGTKPGSFERLARGSGMRLVSPQSAFGAQLEGAEAETFALAPPPSVSTADGAAEMIELYWLALARDVRFAEYAASPVVEAAGKSLEGLSAFAGPHVDGRVLPATVFRANHQGSLSGPHLSQFLWKPIPMGSDKHDQMYRSPVAGNDFMQSYPEWLQLQTGVPPWREYRWEPTRRYIITGRDLAEYVHYDFLYQAFLNAALILMDSGTSSIYNTDYYYSSTNPYKESRTVAGFTTMGFAQVVDWVARVTTPALKAAWYQKWLVHRYLRPEEFGGLVHRTKTGLATYRLHDDVLNSRAAEEVYKRFGSYLLPQAYPEGCPLHPSYPSGHATVAGACVTVLKALFDENLAVPGCVVPSPDGSSLRPYTGPILTVRGELEKLAYNVAFGRCFAGIHWRCDAEAGIQLGEEVAIAILEDLVNTIPEEFEGFRFTRFDGRPVHIQKMA